MSSERFSSSAWSFFCCSSRTFGSMAGPSKALPKPASGTAKVTSRWVWFWTETLRVVPFFIAAITPASTPPPWKT